MASLISHVQLCQAKGQGGDKLRTRSWIEVQLVGEDDAPIPQVKYEIKLPGGQVVAGSLDGQGTVRLEGISPGVCQVLFPDLDKDAWTPLKTQGEQQSTSEQAAA